MVPRNLSASSSDKPSGWISRPSLSSMPCLINESTADSIPAAQMPTGRASRTVLRITRSSSRYDTAVMAPVRADIPQERPPPSKGSAGTVVPSSLPLPAAISSPRIPKSIRILIFSALILLSRLAARIAAEVSAPSSATRQAEY